MTHDARSLAVADGRVRLNFRAHGGRRTLLGLEQNKDVGRAAERSVREECGGGGRGHGRLCSGLLVA